MRGAIFGVVGFAAGAVCGYFYAKKKFASDTVEFEEEETEDDEESDDSEPDDESPPIQDWNPYEKPDILSYSRIIKTNNYSSPEIEKAKKDYIYVIHPAQFGEFSDYSENYMTLYSDGFIVPDDDHLNPLSKTDEAFFFGDCDWKAHIGDHDDGIVHIRNDNLKADYEIAVSLQSFHDPTDEED